MQSLKSRLYRLLRWSEKYTKTDMVYLASGGFWSTAAQVVSSLTVFGFAILVAHVLPKAVYGDYKYILATVALLSSFSLTGIGTAVFQSVASGFDGALREGFWQNLRWSVLIFIGAFVLAAYYFAQGNTSFAFGILIGGSLSPLLTSANIISAFLNAKKDFRRSALYIGIIETLLSVGALAIAVLFTHNPFILAAVYFLGNTLATLWIYRRILRFYKPDPARTDPGMMTYAKHLSLMGVLSTIAGNIDQVLLFHFVGPAELAIYNFAVAIPDQTKGPLKTLNTMMQAKFAARPDEEIRAGMRSKMFWLFISSIIFIILYVLLAPFIYGFFFPNYADAVLYSQIYAISMLSIAFAPAGSYLAAKKKVREQYIVNIGASVIQIAMMAIGVIFWGLLGLVVARVIIKIAGNYLVHFIYSMSVPAKA